MATKIIIEEEEPSLVSSAIEIVACLGGWAAGGVVGVQLNKVLPVAKTAIDVATRSFTIGTGVVVTEHYVSKAIEEECNDVRESIILARVAREKMVSKKQVEEAEKEIKDIKEDAKKK